MATTRDIHLWDIKRIGKDKVIVRTRLSGVKSLRHIARETNNTFKIKYRIGLHFIIQKINKYRVLFLGSLPFIVTLHIMSSFILFIDLEGNNTLTREEMLSTAKEARLQKWALRNNIDPAGIENYIKNKFAVVSWVGVYVEGTKVKIKIVEKKMPENGMLTKLAHLTAKRSGLLKELLVLSGKPLQRKKI